MPFEPVSSRLVSTCLASEKAASRILVWDEHETRRGTYSLVSFSSRLESLDHHSGVNINFFGHKSQQPSIRENKRPGEGSQDP